MDCRHAEDSPGRGRSIRVTERVEGRRRRHDRFSTCIRRFRTGCEGGGPQQIQYLDLHGCVQGAAAILTNFHLETSNHVASVAACAGPVAGMSPCGSTHRRWSLVRPDPGMGFWCRSPPTHTKYPCRGQRHAESSTWPPTRTLIAKSRRRGDITVVGVEHRTLIMAVQRRAGSRRSSSFAACAARPKSTTGSAPGCAGATMRANTVAGTEAGTSSAATCSTSL